MWFRRAEPGAKREPLVFDDRQGLCLSNVHLQREGRPVLMGIDLQLRESRIGIVGDNGCGKSTLLRLFNGLLLPDKGSVRVHGVDTRAAREQLPQRVGFIFQNPEHQLLFPTVEEELAFGLEQYGVPSAEARARAREGLAEGGRGDWAERTVHSLSGGEKQQVCLLAILLMSPRVLLLDEPFSSLDLRARWGFRAELDALQQQLLMVSHDLDLLAQFERIIWLQNGQVFDDGPADAVLKAYRRACRV